MQARLVNKPPYSVSPTAADTYLLCPRKWALRYISKIRQEQTEAAKIGSDCHDHIDQFYRNKNVIAENTKPGQMAKALLMVLPAPNPWIYSESAYHLEISHNNESVYFTAKIDLLDFAQNIVFDHKTTGSFKWAKTPEMLQKDLQAIIYSAIAKYLGMANPAIQWTYVLRVGKPRTQLVKTSIIDLDKKLLSVFELGKYLTTLRYTVMDVDSYPQNPESCGAYGGCYYQDKYCFMTAREKMRALIALQNHRKKGLKR